VRTGNEVQNHSVLGRIQTERSPCKDASVPAIPCFDRFQIANGQHPRWAGLRLIVLLLLAAGSFAALPSQAQNAEPGPAGNTVAQESSPAKQPPESELIFEGQGSFGNYTIFAAGEDAKLFTSGVEYERHSWGHFLGAQVYYVGEFLPFVLLDQPARLTYYGNPRSAQRNHIPGIGVLPIGFRLLWRHDRAVEPYFMGKAGILGFTQKVLSPNASYQDFTLHSEIGLQIRMTQRTDLRLGIGDFHFSNAFVTPANPGLDVMAYDAGICYRFPRAQR
jgi:hypothetical protein